MSDVWRKIGYVILLIIILFVGWLLRHLFVEINHLLTGGGLIALASLFFAIWKYRDNKKKEREDKKEEHEEWLLRDKEALLIDLIDIISIILFKAREHNAGYLQKRMELLLPAFIAHGSKNLLEAWYEFQDMSEVDLSDKFIQAEKLLRVIRKDLGQDDSETPPGHILMVIVKPGEREELLKHFRDVKYD